MLIDMHAHTSGISRCCRLSAPDILERTKSCGMDGIVLTNHYQRAYFKEDELYEFVERYLAEYEYARELGDGIGVKVFFGIEVTMELCDKAHVLVYGVDGDFLRKHATVCDYTLEELYRTVKAAGGAIVQAHPFRNGGTLLDTRYLDGIEISCHPLYKNSFTDEILKIAGENGLAVTVGGDYHADTRRPMCGVRFTDDVDGTSIAKYISASATFDLSVEEAEDGTRKEIVYNRHGGK